MRIITLEEHITFPELTADIPADAFAAHRIDRSPMIQRLQPKLADITGERLQSMDAGGITMQILSVVGPGAELLSKTEGPAFAHRYNDTLAAKIAAHPDRFTAFAHLPMTAPEAAADELERAHQEYGFKGALINGLTGDRFLDDPIFAPLLARAEKLSLPLYLHPGRPPKAVADAYFSGLPGNSGMLLSVSGWGWHAETALHILRLIVSGTFDRYPGLRLIIGHMGEMLPMMMARCDGKLQPGAAGINQRTVSETLRSQVYITTSGLFTLPPLMVAIETFGIDRILFSVDYPFSTNEEGRKFLDSLPLSPAHLARIAHGNADQLLKLQ